MSKVRLHPVGTEELIANVKIQINRLRIKDNVHRVTGPSVALIILLIIGSVSKDSAYSLSVPKIGTT